MAGVTRSARTVGPEDACYLARAAANDPDDGTRETARHWRDTYRGLKPAEECFRRFEELTEPLRPGSPAYVLAAVIEEHVPITKFGQSGPDPRGSRMQRLFVNGDGMLAFGTSGADHVVWWSQAMPDGRYASPEWHVIVGLDRLERKEGALDRLLLSLDIADEEGWLAGPKDAYLQERSRWR